MNRLSCCLSFLEETITRRDILVKEMMVAMCETSEWVVDFGGKEFNRWL